MSETVTLAQVSRWPEGRPRVFRPDPRLALRRLARTAKFHWPRAWLAGISAFQSTLPARLRGGGAARQFARPVVELRPGVDLSTQRVAVTAESDVPEGTLPAFERSFRAVLVADVVGYTRLMEAAELETHARFRTLRVGVGDPTVISHRGEIVKNTGDGFVAVFVSPLDAIRCATELQH